MKPPYNRDYETDNVPDNEQDFHEPPDVSHVHLDTCPECDMPLEREVAWLVECVIDGQSDGWWTGVPKGMGGWITTDAHEAKRYTKADAELVAKTLDYFPSPFNFSHWIATEHVFIEHVEVTPKPANEAEKGI